MDIINNKTTWFISLLTQNRSVNQFWWPTFWKPYHQFYSDLLCWGEKYILHYNSPLHLQFLREMVKTRCCCASHYNIINNAKISAHTKSEKVIFYAPVFLARYHKKTCIYLRWLWRCRGVCRYHSLPLSVQFDYYDRIK